MLKVGVFSWIVLTIVLLAFPLGFLFYFLFKDVTKYFFVFWNKILSEKTLNKIRNEILQENLVNTYQSEEVSEEKQDLLEEESQQHVDEKPSLEELVDREFSKKKKKMIEKIVYEALVYRKEGKLDEYEKKIIE
jgi:isochorismate hydrolase